MKRMNFIAATEEYNTLEKHIPAPYIRKSFSSKTATVGKLTIAVCGFYELFFNGQKITKGFLAPYISNPDDIVYTDTYDVRIERGENVIGILLGNGFQNNPGGYIWDFDQAPFRSAPKMSLCLTYTDPGGETVTVVSDESFRTHPSPIRFDDYRFGEIYDANCSVPGWNETGFDDSDWQNALAAEPPKGELKPCKAEPIVVETEYSAVSIFKEDDGYVYDFGVSNAGVCRLKIRGCPGQKIELQHADSLKDGRFFIDNVWFVRDFWERDQKIVHKDTYVCKGEGTETYLPTFTYHGFRYVKVTGITQEQATGELLTFVVMHSDLKKRGGFSCSQPTLNRLQEMTERSDLSNFYYFPTDCPQREKNGWTADAALSSEQMLLNFNPENSYRQWLENIRKAQAENGALPGIIPTTGWGFEWGNGPAWDCVLFTLPYFTYLYRGETDVITESKDAFMKYLHYLDAKRDEKGLLQFGLGDWCHVGRETPKAPLSVTDTIMSFDIANKAAFLFDAVGLREECAYAKDLATRLKRSFREHLIDFSTMTVSGECQTCQAMGLYYGLFHEEEQQQAFAVLLRLIHENQDHMDVGVLGGRVIFHVLTAFGQSELAYWMIARPDYPSYGNWIERGATTLWENFAPDSVDSPNHHFWGDISAWFIKTVSGIVYNPTRKDWHLVEIKPHFLSALDRAEGFYTSPFGEIRSSWEREDDTVLITVQLPENMKARVTLPPGYCLCKKEPSAFSGKGVYRLKIRQIG
ncbi:MAG: family 78 glycoside hydrolase catalytic domain [Clostridia bacterium]|nr:family 78 glycoside hydrolase catalytic domain [Clostridia bacterium]